MNNSLSILLIYSNYIFDRLYLLIKRKFQRTNLKTVIFMVTEKPKQLIDLLNKLKNETDKTTYQSIYIDIAKEVMSLEFKHNPKQPFQGLVYKKLVQLSVK